MSRYENFHGDPAASALSGLVPADVLLDLADGCEQAGLDQQAACLSTALHVIGGHLVRRGDQGAPERLERTGELIRAGVFEAAALALLAPTTVFTLARLADGSVIAQVQLVAGRGAHSRAARWPGMALLAALLRALADEAGQAGTA